MHCAFKLFQIYQWTMLMDLYHTLDNIANQNTGKQLHTQQYYTQPSHHVLNICPINYVGHCILYGVISSSYAMVLSGIPWSSHLYFPAVHMSLQAQVSVYTKKIWVASGYFMEYHPKAWPNLYVPKGFLQQWWQSDWKFNIKFLPLDKLSSAWGFIDLFFLLIGHYIHVSSP